MSAFNNQFKWHGRVDTEDGEAGCRWHQKVTHEYTQAGIGLVGLACDLGVGQNQGRLGAKAGPDTIRTALANLAWHLDSPVHDGGTVCALDDLPLAQFEYGELIAQQLNQHQFVVGLGGGHEIAWGSYSGLSKHLSDRKKRIGVLNFDAHFDLRKPAPHPSSGTPFYQISQWCKANQRPFAYACLGIADTANTPALFDFANAHKVTYLRDLDCEFAATCALLSPFLANVDELYVTICLDVFPAAQAPGVSAPSGLGISPEYVIRVIHWLASQQKSLKFNWQLADIAEMNPQFDIDGRTAKLAARLVHELCVAQQKGRDS